ncbi:MAG: aminopeptidase [Actinomycetota bacterium]|nr:aminopeptidase [Actinomycetota bacterium]
MTGSSDSSPSSLDGSVRTVLDDCLGVRPGEQVLVLSDPAKAEIARALVDGARLMGAEAVSIEMAERETHGTEPPPAVAAAMLACDVLIAPTSKSVSHTSARRAATEKGVRAATMPDITVDMLARTMSADFDGVKRRSRAVAELLTAGDAVRITSAKGSDLRLSIAGRTAISDDGDLREPGAFGNLPAGEGFIAPVEGTATGRLVVDGTVWPLGLLEDPLVVDFEDGYATSIAGAGADRFRAALEPYGRDAFAVAELGIGTNEAAILTGNVLEDEKILGTIHLALGDNHSFGGTVRVSSHQDGIVLDPTLTIDDRTILQEGDLLI